MVDQTVNKKLGLECLPPNTATFNTEDLQKAMDALERHFTAEEIIAAAMRHVDRRQED
ncbi:MAG: hypothetical protein ABGZ23_25220 [Fuerstiella sp.]